MLDPLTAAKLLKETEHSIDIRRLQAQLTVISMQCVAQHSADICIETTCVLTNNSNDKESKLAICKE